MSNELKPSCATCAHSHLNKEVSRKIGAPEQKLVPWDDSKCMGLPDGGLHEFSCDLWTPVGE